MEIYVIKNVSCNLTLTNYIFIRGTITSVAPACLSFLGVVMINPLIIRYNNVLSQRTYIVHGALSLIIAWIWLLGYISV